VRAPRTTMAATEVSSTARQSDVAWRNACRRAPRNISSSEKPTSRVFTRITSSAVTGGRPMAAARPKPPAMYTSGSQASRQPRASVPRSSPTSRQPCHNTTARMKAAAATQVQPMPSCTACTRLMSPPVVRCPPMTVMAVQRTKAANAIPSRVFMRVPPACPSRPSRVICATYAGRAIRDAPRGAFRLTDAGVPHAVPGARRPSRPQGSRRAGKRQAPTGQGVAPHCPRGAACRT
jgi:hypothetical protein